MVDKLLTFIHETLNIIIKVELVVVLGLLAFILAFAKMFPY